MPPPNASLYHLNLLSMLALLHCFPVPLEISSIALHKSLNVVGPPNLGPFPTNSFPHPAGQETFVGRIFRLLRTGLGCIAIVGRCCAVVVWTVVVWTVVACAVMVYTILVCAVVVCTVVVCTV